MLATLPHLTDIVGDEMKKIVLFQIKLKISFISKLRKETKLATLLRQFDVLHAKLCLPTKLLEQR